MPSKAKHSERFPDYNVPYTMLSYLSTGHFILSYANFYEKWWKHDNKPETFTYEQHSKFRLKPMRKDSWHQAALKLVKNGWLTVDDSCNYRITPEGVKACRSVAARNSARPDRKDRPHMSNKD